MKGYCIRWYTGRAAEYWSRLRIAQPTGNTLAGLMLFHCQSQGSLYFNRFHLLLWLIRWSVGSQRWPLINIANDYNRHVFLYMSHTDEFALIARSQIPQSISTIELWCCVEQRHFSTQRLFSWERIIVGLICSKAGWVLKFIIINILVSNFF